MEERIVMNALAFLERATLKGDEAEAFLEVKHALSHLIKREEMQQYSEVGDSAS